MISWYLTCEALPAIWTAAVMRGLLASCGHAQPLALLASNDIGLFRCSFDNPLEPLPAQLPRISIRYLSASIRLRTLKRVGILRHASRRASC